MFSGYRTVSLAKAVENVRRKSRWMPAPVSITRSRIENRAVETNLNASSTVSKLHGVGKKVATICSADSNHRHESCRVAGVRFIWIPFASAIKR
jgi:hypothetical protein